MERTECLVRIVEFLLDLQGAAVVSAKLVMREIIVKL